MPPPNVVVPPRFVGDSEVPGLVIPDCDAKEGAEDDVNGAGIHAGAGAEAAMEDNLVKEGEANTDADNVIDKAPDLEGGSSEDNAMLEVVVPSGFARDSEIPGAVAHPQAVVHLQPVIPDCDAKEGAEGVVNGAVVHARGEADATMEDNLVEEGEANSNADDDIDEHPDLEGGANVDNTMQDDDVSYDNAASGDEEVVFAGVAAAPPSPSSCLSMAREAHLYLLLGSATIYLNHNVPYNNIFGVAASSLLPWFPSFYSSVNGFRRLLAAYVHEEMCEREFLSIVGTISNIRQSVGAYVHFLHGHLEPSEPDLGQYSDINIIVRFLRARGRNFTGSVWVVNMNQHPPFYEGLTLVDDRTVYPNQVESEIVPGDIVFVNAYAKHWRSAESRPQQKQLR
jgi:hypothetical protein